MRGLVGDVRMAIRTLRAAPAVTIAAILTLALGIGATAAIFSVANGLVLRPLPVSEPHELVTITSDMALRHGFQAGAGWSYAMWEELRRRAEAFHGAFAWTLQRVDLSEGGEMQPVNALFASGDFFKALGVNAAIGRTFTVADDVPGGGPDGAVAVISHHLWRHHFNGRGDVVGSRLFIEGTPVTIVGVVSERFRGIDVGQPFDVAVPFGAEALIRGRHSLTSSPRSLLLTVMLRLKPDQSISKATAALRAMQPEIVGPDAPEFLREPFLIVGAATGISDRSRLRQQYRYPLVILSAISGLVLLVVCLNIANLLLSRASARRSELSVRLALGAPRWRLARSYFVEALTLGSIGTAAGMLFAAWASRAVLMQLPSPNGPVQIDLANDWRTLMFTVGVALAAVVLFGTMPALYATRVPPLEALREGGRGAGARRTAPLSSGLVLAQVALSLVLLAGTGLFVRTVQRLASVTLGFDPQGILVISVDAARSLLKPEEPAQLRQRGTRGSRGRPWRHPRGWVHLDTGRHGWRGTADRRARPAFGRWAPGRFQRHHVRLVRDVRDADASRQRL